MTVAYAVRELVRLPRAGAVGVFDGVHAGHRRVLEAVAATRLAATVVTFDPHPRARAGEPVELLSTLERRLELLVDAAAEDVLVLDPAAVLSAAQLADGVLAPIGAEIVVAGPGFPLAGGLAPLAERGLEVRSVPLVERVSTAALRALVRAGEVDRAARLLGRPPELDGTVVSGDRRGTLLGFPTANLAVPAGVVVPRYGIYAGAAGGTRAAVSIGTNPHYGGSERRIEAFLLDFGGDLYGRRLVIELWRRLRDERAFASEAALVEQIARDVEATRAAVRPA